MIRLTKPLTSIETLSSFMFLMEKPSQCPLFQQRYFLFSILGFESFHEIRLMLEISPKVLRRKPLKKPTNKRKRRPRRKSKPQLKKSKEKPKKSKEKRKERLQELPKPNQKRRMMPPKPALRRKIRELILHNYHHQLGS